MRAREPASGDRDPGIRGFAGLYNPNPGICQTISSQTLVPGLRLRHHFSRLSHFVSGEEPTDEPGT